MKISKRVLELWPAQDLTTMGNNSRMDSARVVICIHDMPTQYSQHIDEMS